MSEQDCQMCPQLMARLAGVAGGAYALAAFVEQEMTEPTMPRRDLLPAVVIRAENLAEQAEGMY